MGVSQEEKASRRRAAPLVIDGEAVIVNRVALVKSAVERAASAPPVFASDAPDVPRRHAETGGFGRRGEAPGIRQRRPAPDLFFQARSAGRFARPSRSVADGVSLFMRDRAGSVQAGRRMAGLGLFVVSLLVPAAFLVDAKAPVALDGQTLAGPAVAGFVIENLTAKVSARGAGDVLEVEGSVRNVSGAAAPVPPLRIGLADSRGTTLRPVSTGNRVLAAGAILRFHSAVAVPDGTQGDVSVAFGAASRPSEPFELAEAGDTIHRAH